MKSTGGGVWNSFPKFYNEKVEILVSGSLELGVTFFRKIIKSEMANLETPNPSLNCLPKPYTFTNLFEILSQCCDMAT